jgi:hypothetical protein
MKKISQLIKDNWTEIEQKLTEAGFKPPFEIKSAKKKKYNPYAVCTKSVGREDEAKYKRCKEHVEEQNNE